MAQHFMIYVPEINRESFVFFFFRHYEGQADPSFSIHDFSTPGKVRRWGQQDLEGITAHDVLRLARRPGCRLEEVNEHLLTDRAYWHGVTLEFNRQLPGASECPAAS